MPRFASRLGSSNEVALRSTLVTHVTDARAQARPLAGVTTTQRTAVLGARSLRRRRWSLCTATHAQFGLDIAVQP
ncbi:MAG: hypothetical protein CMN30_01715 [Sandaracinus sp.]|nr:hypothetical protein [Sandaracinus sp.]